MRGLSANIAPAVRPVRVKGSGSGMRGFTLVEIMVVTLLLTIMSMLSWRALESMVHSRDVLDRRGEGLEAAYALFLLWQRDCEALGPKDDWPEGQPAHVGHNRIDLIRLANPGRVGRQLVTYRWRNGGVERLVSPAIDQRGPLLETWHSLEAGADPESLFAPAERQALLPAQGIDGLLYFDGQGWHEAAQPQGPQPQGAPAGSPLLRGMALQVRLAGATNTLHRTCLTGPD